MTSSTGVSPTAPTYKTVFRQALFPVQMDTQILQGLLQRCQTIIGDHDGARPEAAAEQGACCGMLNQAIKEFGCR